MNIEERIRKLEDKVRILKKQLITSQYEERLFKTAVDDLKEMLVRFDANGVITLANDAYCKYFNKSREDLIGLNYLPHIPQEDIVKIEELSDSLSYKNNTVTIEHRVFSSDGSIKWTRWIHQGFFNEEHVLIDTQAIGIDITKQRIMQNELREKDLQLKAIYNNAGVGICLLSPAGRVLNTNKKILDMFGYTDNEIIGLDCSDFVEKEFKPAHDTYFTRITEKQITYFQTDLMYKNMSGNIFWCELTVSPILKDDGSVESIIYMLNNIEERKKTEKLQKEIIQKTSSEKEKAELANNTKAEFIAQMSHEIRTPMNAIINMTDAALDTDLTLLQRDSLQTVKESSEQLLILINDILDFSKIEADRLIVENDDFNLLNVLNFMLKSMNPIAKPKSISLKLQLSEDVPKYLKGDPKLLRQIILNLMSNSIKFTSHGSIILSVSRIDRKTATAERDNKLYLEFCVEDTGIGIPQEKLESIFDSFTQANNSISKKYGGTGLGLTITKKFVLAMGGSIHANSREGQGSKFIFSLPFELGNPNNIEKSDYNIQAVPKASLPQLKLILADRNKNQQQRILLVEDNETNRKVANYFLTRKDYFIDNASNGKEAVDRLSKNDFDIILMDIEMPVMDGFETTMNIRKGEAGEKNRNIPIIGMTAHIGRYYQDKCIKVGMNSYASKPIRFQKLENIITETLRSARIPTSYNDILDIDMALSLYEGDTAFLNELLALFRSSKPCEVAKLKNILFNTKTPSEIIFKNAMVIAHSIKGDASAIGAIKLQTVSNKMETFLKNKNLDFAKQLFMEFETEFNKVVDIIEE